MPSTKANQRLSNRRSSGSIDSASTVSQCYDLTDSDNKQNDKCKNKGNSQQNDNSNDNNNNNSSKSWWKRCYDNYSPSLVLENKASVARDNLGSFKKYHNFIS